MTKKYEFTGETKTLSNGTILHRIKRLSDGLIGGWIEKEKNLSHEGDCFVYGNVWVFGNAKVFGNARIYDNVRVFGNVKVYDNAWVFGNAIVSGDAVVSGNAEVYGDANVSGYARVSGDAVVSGNARVYGDARVSGNAVIYGNAKVFGNAEIKLPNDLLVVGPIGSRNGYTSFYRTKDNTIEVSCGCFQGTIDKFLEKVKETHGDNKHGKTYRALVEVARIQIMED